MSDSEKDFIDIVFDGPPRYEASHFWRGFGRVNGMITRSAITAVSFAMNQAGFHRRLFSSSRLRSTSHS